MWNTISMTPCMPCRLIEIVFLLDVVSGLPKELPGTHHNRRFGAHDVFEQLAGIRFKQGRLI